MRDIVLNGLLAQVSVVVPTHRRPEMLSRLLKSFRKLAYPAGRLELIVVGVADDPGRHVALEFARSLSFPTAYTCVPHDALQSASCKRNEGARAARGEILAFTDDDCVVHPDWLAVAVPFFSVPKVGGVEGAIEIPATEKPTFTFRSSRRLSLSGGYQTANMLYRRSVFEQCGGFDERFPYYLEDTDLAYTVMERGYAIPFALAAVVCHPAESARPLKLLTLARTVERIPYLYRKHPQSKKQLRETVRLLHRSHYPYLALYGAALIVALLSPVASLVTLALGLGVLLAAHLVHDYRGLHFTAGELVLTGLCQPLVPVMRVFYWVKGMLWLRFHRAGALRQQGQQS